MVDVGRCYLFLTSFRFLHLMSGFHISPKQVWKLYYNVKVVKHGMCSREVWGWQRMWLMHLLCAVIVMVILCYIFNSHFKAAVWYQSVYFNSWSFTYLYGTAYWKARLTAGLTLPWFWRMLWVDVPWCNKLRKARLLCECKGGLIWVK